MTDWEMESHVKPFVFGCVAVAVLLIAPASRAEEGLSLDGFLQSHVAARTGSIACSAGTECNYPAAELRGQIKAEGSHASGKAAFAARFDLVRDIALDETRLGARELYGDLISEKLTARAGRQIVTWGVGDLLFINDTFPKDWSAFFTGQPMQYLKLGSDAAKLNYYADAVNLEILVAGFRPDSLPDNRRFVFADPLPPGMPRRTVEPGNSAGELEASGKLSGYAGNWELAGYVSRTHYRSPAMRVGATEIVGAYPRLNAYGASLTGPLGKGVLSLEGGYYDSPEDRNGRDPSVENSQFRSLVGYSQQLWEDATLSGQLYGEWMRDYAAYRATLPAGFPAKDRVREVATLHFTQMFAHQAVTFNFFAFWGLSEKDRYFIPSLRYAFNDNLWAEIGANIFAGSRNGVFGSMQNNRNAYLTVRYAH